LNLGDEIGLRDEAPRTPSTPSVTCGTSLGIREKGTKSERAWTVALTALAIAESRTRPIGMAG